MPRVLAVAVSGVVLVATLGAQTVNHERSGPIPDAAFDIIQSPLAARHTFRLNRVTGQVNQLIADDHGKIGWQSLPAVADPAGDSRGRISYAMFTSGLAARYTFLVNIHTGATWQLLENSETKDLFWRRVTEPH